MPLTSRMLKGDPAFESALVNDRAHITPGSRGNQVWKIQAALMIVMDPPPKIAGNELATKAKFYGPTTTAAVLEFKRTRDIINRSYENDYDPIVGKMTVAQLDKELRDKEGGDPSPGYDPGEADRIQALLNRDRPGVCLLLYTTLHALQKVKQGFDSGSPAAGATLLRANAQAVSGLARLPRGTDELPAVPPSDHWPVRRIQETACLARCESESSGFSSTSTGTNSEQ